MAEDTDDSQRFALIGDRFPDLTVNTTHGEKRLPDDYEGEWFVLFSHPGDFTPVCTSEFVAFEQRREEFEEEYNANLIGLSVDRIHSHIKWTDWIQEELDVDIGFPIIADEGGHVGKQFGMIHLNAGINLVGLGQPTSCPGKDSRLEWIDSRYRQTTGCKRGTNWPLITAGRLLEVIYREDYGYKKQEPEFMTFGHRARIKRASLEAPLRTTGEEKRRTSWQPSTRLMPSTERAPFRSRPAACRKKESGP